MSDGYDDADPEAFGIEPIDWATFWASEAPVEDWLLEPIVPAGRGVALYSPAKVGKSLLALDIAAAAATGRPILGQAATTPIDVVYLDLEMTEADVRERLTDLGYGPDDDLSRLHYYQLPTLPPLSTALGGELLFAITDRHQAQLVVIDTMARVVNGPENDADPYRDFYRHTGARLKAAGIALLRLDHAGKDPTAGQRGSSAKVEDVDVVFRLSSADGQADRFVLKRTHSRVPWVPVEVHLQRHDEPLRHVLAADSWPAGTGDLAAILDDLDVPLDATSAMATTALKAAGHGRRKLLVLAALRWRRERP